MLLYCTQLTYRIHPGVSHGVTFNLIPNWIGFCHGQILIETATYSSITIIQQHLITNLKLQTSDFLDCRMWLWQLQWLQQDFDNTTLGYSYEGLLRFHILKSTKSEVCKCKLIRINNVLLEWWDITINSDTISWVFICILPYTFLKLYHARYFYCGLLSPRVHIENDDMLSRACLLEVDFLEPWIYGLMMQF